MTHISCLFLISSKLMANLAHAMTFASLESMNETGGEGCMCEKPFQQMSGINSSTFNYRPATTYMKIISR